MPRPAHLRRYQRFRSLLIQRRKEAGLTQEAVAKAIGRPQSFVAKVESGERRLDVVEFLELSAAIGFEPEAFVHELQK